jgi:hypothetical protein
MFEVDASETGRLLIEDIEIVYDDGYSEHIEVPNSTYKSSSASLVTPNDGPFTPYRTQDIHLPEVITRRQNFNLKVRGALYDGHEPHPFNHDIRVVLSEEHNYHLGWLHLLLKNANF